MFSGLENQSQLWDYRIFDNYDNHSDNNDQKGWDPNQGWWRFSLAWLSPIAFILVSNL